jgi:hypothetical protein
MLFPAPELHTAPPYPVEAEFPTIVLLMIERLPELLTAPQTSEKLLLSALSEIWSVQELQAL